MDKLCSFEPVYSDDQRRLIDQEFERIKDEHFLDHAGGTLYSEIQIENISVELKKTLLCNPHAKNIPSQKTEDALDILRFRILKYFHTNPEEYTVIFTANTSASLKLVGENFDFGFENDSKGCFTYLEDNHTSVLGLRNYSEASKCITTQEAFSLLEDTYKEEAHILPDTNSLFVYPAQCNFSGTKYPLQWIEKVQKGQLNHIKGLKSKNWYVLLDAAAFVGTNTLDLSVYKPDFVTFSFYKIFGYPSGVGALLVKNQSHRVLRKKYYGGGTVLMALAKKNEAILKSSLSERFEDGTPPYLSIYTLNEGFNTLSRLRLTPQLISKHTFNLARYLYGNLLTLHHANGQPSVILYHDTVFADIRHQGGIVNFNLVREDGRIIGYSEVMQMSNLHKIHLRTGCSCNPGACQRHLRLTSDDVRRHFHAGHVCGDQNDLVDGVPTGSVRVSFGYMSRKEDADAVLKMIKDCFILNGVLIKLPYNYRELEENYRSKFLKNSFDKVDTKLTTFRPIELKQDITLSLEHAPVISFSDKFVKGVLKYVLLYPIKSCGAFAAPKSWKICNSGLEYDRKWMIVNSNGSCLSQKQYSNMCLIKPIVDIEHGTLKLTFQEEGSITLRLHDTARRSFNQCESKICRDRVIGYDCGDDVSSWLSKCLKCQGLRLIQQIDNEIARVNRKGEQLQLSFVNESQYLMVNLASVRWLYDRVREKEPAYSESLESMVLRFRPNIVIDFGEAFIENELEMVDIDSLSFKTVGSCTRCQMICINQVNAQKTKEPLITLAREFEGKVKFGVYLQNVDTGRKKNTIELGSVAIAKMGQNLLN